VGNGIGLEVGEMGRLRGKLERGRVKAGKGGSRVIGEEGGRVRGGKGDRVGGGGKGRIKGEKGRWVVAGEKEKN
jgi:hypothetical protein